MSGRTLLNFGLHGLNDREALLFKSCMNIISSRTRHQWVWRKNVVNLLVLTDDTVGQLSESFKTLPIICIGDKIPTIRRGDGRHEYLARPLRPMDILSCVDRLGDMIIRNGSVEIDLRAISNTTMAAVRLRRWPPVQLLSDTYRTRLATLLTGQPVTLTWLQQRSGAPASVCTDFLAELERADLLESTYITTLPKVAINTAATHAPKMGLLGRIRQRLGLDQPAAAYI